MVSDNKKPLNSTLQAIADQMKASEHLKDMDPTQIASAVIQGVKSAFAIQAAPCHTLPEILPHLTVNKLRLLYLLHSQSDKPGKRNKQQLIDALIPMIPDPQRLMAYVLLLPAMQWDLLKKALKNAELKGTHYAVD